MPADVVAERFERLKTVIDRSALARHQARVGRSEEVLVEGVSRRDDGDADRRAPARASSSTSRRAGAGAPAAGALAPCHRDRGPSPPPVGPARGGDGAAPPPGAHPGGGRVTAVALVGVTASGKSDGRARPRPAPRRLRDRLGRLHVRVPRHGHRHLQAGSPRPGPRCRTTCSTWSTRTRSSPCRSSRRAPAPRSAASRPAGHHALLVGGTGLYLRAVVDDLAIPGRYPDVAAALEAELDDGPAPSRPTSTPACAALDPVGAGRMAPTNRRRVVRALEVTLGSGRPFSDVRARARGLPGDRGRARSAWPVPPDEVDRRIAARFDAMVEAGLVEEVRALAARPGGLSRTARQALGYREILGPRGGRRPAGRVRGGGRPADAAVRPPPGLVVPPRPAHQLGHEHRRGPGLLEQALSVHG